MIVSSKVSLDAQFENVKAGKGWDIQSKKELGMHKIHVYPAKFPSFLISKSLEYANRNKIKIETIGDIFCGCGTSALEAKINNKNFWGCDINPVATLIAKVKSENYVQPKLEFYFNEVIEKFSRTNYSPAKKFSSNERIQFWFEEIQIEKLYNLQRAIRSVIPKGKYMNFFLVAFSNILKGSSRWLTKSIKPTIDKSKSTKDPIKLFKAQFKAMLKAVIECNIEIQSDSQTNIINQDFLKKQASIPFLDLLITSPPYVTSYEYADLHQLSTLWLGYTKDFRIFREGTIGSVYHHSVSQDDIDQLSPIAKNIYNKLVKAKKSKARSIAKYFIDIKKTISKSHSIINPGGLAIFIIGNTTYKDVYVDNAKYLTECFLDCGFNEIEVIKRRISSKILSPYRNKDGKFSNDKRKRKVYNYEFVLIAKK